jgi:hypothetical protein
MGKNSITSIGLNRLIAFTIISDIILNPPRIDVQVRAEMCASVSRGSDPVAGGSDCWHQFW